MGAQYEKSSPSSCISVAPTGHFLVIVKPDSAGSVVVSYFLLEHFLDRFRRLENPLVSIMPKNPNQQS